MSSVLFAPHNDDETLFASFLILRHKPAVIVCLYENEERATESENALAQLMCHEFTQWQYPAQDPPWQLIQAHIERVAREYDYAFAPCPYGLVGGHGQHDRIGDLVLNSFGEERVTLYHTYVRTLYHRPVGEELAQRVILQGEVEYEPHWIARKLSAMSCYSSQHGDIRAEPWFMDSTLREYVVG